MTLEDIVRNIRDSLIPNRVYAHPRVEIISATAWKKVATLSANVVVWYLHIQHTGNGEGVFISYKEDPEDKDIIGPYFGDNPLYPPAAPITVPTTERKRRTRPRHIYAKLAEGFWVPPVPEAGALREHGPYVSIEEWSFVDKAGLTDEVIPDGVKDLNTGYIDEISKQQKMIGG